MTKKLTDTSSKPLTVSIPFEFARRIDGLRREVSEIPARGAFLRIAVEEKLARDTGRSNDHFGTEASVLEPKLVGACH